MMKQLLIIAFVLSAAAALAKTDEYLILSKDNDELGSLKVTSKQFQDLEGFMLKVKS